MHIVDNLTLHNFLFIQTVSRETKIKILKTNNVSHETFLQQQKKINTFNANLLHKHFSICFTWNTIFPFPLQPDCFMWNTDAISFFEKAFFVSFETFISKRTFTTKESCFVSHETIPKGSFPYSFVCKPDKSYFLSVFPLKQCFMWNNNRWDLRN